MRTLTSLGSGTVFSLFVVVSLALDSAAYPIDGHQKTGIKRLERPRQIAEGTLQGRPLRPGARRPMAEVKLNLTGSKGFPFVAPAPDSALQRDITRLFKGADPTYAFAMVDLTPGKPLRFAQWQADRIGEPGSVGKLAIAAGLFTELKRMFPSDIEKRKDLLRTRTIVADDWVITNSHEVPFFDLTTKAYVARRVKPGDTFTLWEWTDHMISASSNAAASIVWKELLLMRRFGVAYPPSAAQEKEFFAKTPKDTLKAMALSVVNDPLRALGIAQEAWQLGSFFTRTGKARVPGAQSYATPRALLTYVMSMEQGKIVDEWSSLEIKKLMYLTVRRVRYAGSSRLDSAMVYFKSGSQYKCKPETLFVCEQYKGNDENFLNAVAIVEHPDGVKYAAVLMSNVLRKNSADDHRDMATAVDRIIRPTPPATAKPKNPSNASTTPAKPEATSPPPADDAD